MTTGRDTPKEIQAEHKRAEKKVSRSYFLKCARCGEAAPQIKGWKPSSGFDPHLMGFKCSRCGSIFYKIRHEGR